MGVIGPGFLNQVPTLRVYVWDSRPKVPDFGLERFGCGVKGLGLRVSIFAVRAPLFPEQQNRPGFWPSRPH